MSPASSEIIEPITGHIEKKQKTTTTETYKKLHNDYKMLIQEYEKEIEKVKQSNQEHSRVLELYDKLNQKHHELINFVSSNK